MQKLWFSYLLFFFFAFLSSQDIQQKGLPFMQNYLPQDYGNHGKIWDIKSAKNGLVYMASEGGLLEFDGQLWNRPGDIRWIIEPPGNRTTLAMATDNPARFGNCRSRTLQLHG